MSTSNWNLSNLSIRRPVFAWMLMFAIIVFGGIALSRLGISQMPDVDFPVVSINLSLPGAAPEVMENQVVDVIEDAVMGIEGIRNVASSSQQSSANINIEFELSKDIDVAIQDVQARISRIQNLLPTSLDPPTIRKTNPEDQPILWLVLSNKDGTSNQIQEQIDYARDFLFDQLSTTKGVGDIFLGGFVDTNLRIWVSTKKLADHELTVTDLIKSIQANHQEIPIGKIENTYKESNIRLMGEANDPKSFSKIPITFRGGRANYQNLELGSIARIEEGLNDIRKISRFNKMQSIGLGILKQHGSNAIEVVDAVRKKVETLRPLIPPNFSLSIRSDQTKFIRDSIHELTFTLILSAILTSFVCFLFLGSWSSTFNVLLAIPTSIIGSFIVIYFFHFTLNTYTLLGLSLAIGIVVDDAIMMLENIMRHLSMGKNRVEAALSGANEISFAALAATVAVVAIFLPVIFMKGIIGRYFYQFGITVTAAVLFSLLEALTLTPMRCSRFLKIKKNQSRITQTTDRFLNSVTKIYSQMLVFCLSHRWLILSLSVIFFISSIAIIRKVPGEMIPSQDQSQFMLRLKTPVGSSIVFTDKKTKEVENILSEKKEIDGFFVAVGGFGGESPNQAMMFATLVPREKRSMSQSTFMASIREELKMKVKQAQIFIQDTSLRGFSPGRGFPIEFNIQGSNWEKLGELSFKIMDAIKDAGVVVDVNTDYQINTPEIQLIPDRDKASLRGVALTDVAQTVNAMLGGTVMGSQTRYFRNGHRYDIRLRLEPNERDNAVDVKNLHVRNNRGELVPLSEVINVKEAPTLQVVSRQNRERAIKIFGNIAAGHSQEDAIKSIQKIASSLLPNDYHIEFAGSSQAYKESMQSLFFAMFLGIIVSYMILASQFNSFLHPITILIALPFSITGAFIGLYLTHQTLNMFSMIGLILLMGIVKKNSILLVEFTNQLRQKGLPVKDAILTACPIRLRPILMTSIATIVGAIPAAIHLGPGAETRIPMAVAIIGGVLASTFLTLFVVPCFYSLTAFSKNTVNTLNTQEIPKH